MIGTVERQAAVHLSGHPRVVIPLVEILQKAGSFLGARAIESHEKGIEKENQSHSTLKENASS